MIARLRGTVAEIGADRLVVDVNGVGYEVLVPTRTAESARVDAAITVHIHTVVREDTFALYGFLTSTDKECFQQLIGVNQVGPKIGLAALSAYSADVLALAVNGNDLRTLARISGVGPKTAQRIVLELRGKLAFSAAAIAGTGPTPAAPRATPDDPLPLALAQLGYKKSEIDLAVARLVDRGLAAAPLEQRLAESLRIFAAGGGRA